MPAPGARGADAAVPGWDPDEPEARSALRNASLLLGQRGLDVLRALAFAALVPRLLGPPDYGRFALLSSVGFWFSLLSGLGSTQLMGRFVPLLVLRQDHQAQRRLLGNLLAVRTMGGAAAAATYLLLLLSWLRDMPLGLLAPMAGAVLLRAAANVPFAFFLGLNQAARWGAGELARRWASLTLVLAGTLLAGVRGACLGVLLAEACVLALGLHWARAHLSLADVRIERDFIAPYLRYNLLFFGSNLLFAVCQRGGEALVRAAARDYAEVGFFGVAASAYLLAAHSIGTLLMAFLPLLARLRAQGRMEAAREWAGRLLRLLSAASVVAGYGAVLLGPSLVPVLLGEAFRPVGALLPPVGLAVLAHAMGSVGRVMALTLDRPRLSLAASAVHALALVGLGLPLAARAGALGAVLALAVAAALHAAVLLHGVRAEAPVRLRSSLAVVAAGVPFLPMALPEPVWPLRVAMFLLFLGGYAVLLHSTRLLTLTELLELRRGLRSREASPSRAPDASTGPLP